ncbi:MAG: HEAT repeat domain-containing protein [Archangium sp.]|nr:HEAT repeat domain-containing protein [Archangium sp.]
MRRALLVFAGLVVTALLVWSGHDTNDSQPFQFSLTSERAWQVQWRATDRTEVAGELQRSQLDLSAMLRLRPVRDGLLEARLEQVQLNALSFLGQTLPIPAEAFERTVRLHVDQNGRVTSMEAEGTADPLVVHLLSALHDELSVDVQAAWAERTVTQPNRYGSGSYRYTRHGSGFRRTLVSQPALQGLGDATITVTGVDAMGWNGFFTTRSLKHHLEGRRGVGGALALESDESLTLTPCEVPSTPWQQPTSFVAHERFALSSRAEQSARAQRIDGLTAQAFLDDLSNFGRTGQMPDHARWLRRATALLAANPALCAEVEKWFLDPTVGVPGRTLALDLLTNAGTPEAQHSLVTLLSSQTARGDAAWPLYVQRLSLLTEPTTESATFALTQFETARSRDEVGATAMTLGALARHLPQGDAMRSDFTRRLQTGFAQAQGAERRAMWLDALAASGRPEVLPQVKSATNDSNPLVRATAAHALGALGDEDALKPLAVDADARVREAAIRHLGSAPIETVTTLVANAPSDPMADSAWVTVLTSRLAEPGVREVLQHLLARTHEPQLAARLHTLLET